MLVNNPLVTVIIPTFKRATYLDRAITSVLKQDYKNIEIIIVDDNNPDTEFRKETEEKMKKYEQNDNIIYLKHEKNKNGAAARNTGINHSKGEYITFLDDDDIFIENRISRIVEELEKDENKKYGGAYTNIKMISPNSEKMLKDISITTSGNMKRELLMGEFTIGSGSNMLFRREIITSINGFDVRFKRHQDWEFLIRFFRESQLLYLEELLVIKYADNAINIPNSYLFENVKKLFLDTFKKDISEFNKEDQEKIYAYHAYELAIKYAKDSRIKEALELLKKHKKYMPKNSRKEISILYIKSIAKNILKILKLR